MPPEKKEITCSSTCYARPSFRKRQEIELFLPEKLKNVIKTKKSIIPPYPVSRIYVLVTQGAQERRRRLVNRRVGTGGPITTLISAIADMEVIYGAEALGGSCR
jgi:hypothetical protein